MVCQTIALNNTLQLLVATLAVVASTLSFCDGFASPPMIEGAAVTKEFLRKNILPASMVLRRKDSVLRNDDDVAGVRKKCVALASFDFFQPVDDFYDDDDDDLYGSNDDRAKASGSGQEFGNEYGDGADHRVHWLDPEMQGLKSLGEAIADGEAVVTIPNVADFGECLDLVQAGLNARAMRGGGDTAAARGRSRFSVSDPSAFPDGNVVLSCDEILLRVLDYLDDRIPSVYETLFRPSEDWLWRQPLNAMLEEPTVPPEDYLAETCGSLRELYLMGELEWSEGEPAINVYESEGYFGCHKDHLALTVLIPLTSPGDQFLGGGTGYWRGNRMVDENPSTPPDVVLTPEKGTALVFGGDVTHSGMPVEEGYRSVFVCSFSTRTPASAPNRLHGMQAPPEVSPNFKGTM